MANSDGAVAARRAALGFTWLALIAWAVFVAPAGDGQDPTRIVRWLQLDGPPLLVAIFNLLGVWPLVYGAVLLRDPPQRVPAWPFVGLSFATGAYALLPYLILRTWGTPGRAELGRVRSVMTGRAMAGGLLIASLALVGGGLALGDFASLAEEAPRSGLVTTMTADFVVVTITWWALLLDDVRRHDGPAWSAALGAIPIVGAPLWLLLRPRPSRAAES